jgi:hypothetical protein
MISHMKLSNAQRTFAFSVAAILMATYQLSPLPAWACAAEATGSFGYSSNTGATSVTVCAKSVTATRTVSTTTKEPVAKAPATKAPVAKAPVSKPEPKPSPAPVKVVSLLSPLKQGIPAALQKPAPKPAAKPAPKPAPKPVAAPVAPKALAATNSGVSISTASEEVSFSPAPVLVSSSAGKAKVSQPVGFWANASTHFKSGILLGKVTDVRFTPVQTSWITDQGQSGVGASISLAFENEGSVEVAATVTYSVSYQIAGASGWVSSGDIEVSDSVVVIIED